MSPFLIIVAINATIIAAAYGLIYPRLRPLTARRMVLTDVVMTVLALVVAGVFFWGEGLSFALGPISLPWWGASILTLVILEIPVFWYFCRANGISFDTHRNGRD